MQPDRTSSSRSSLLAAEGAGPADPAAAVGLAHLDLEGHLLWLDSGLARMLACPAEDLVGSDLAELVLAEDLEQGLAALADLRRDPSREVLTRLRCRSRDGRVFEASLKLALAGDPGEAPSVVVACLAEVPAGDAAPAEGPGASEHRFRMLFERSSDGILLIKGDVFVDCNRAAARLLGYDDPAELLETHPSQISPDYQPDGRPSRQKADEMIRLAFEHGNHRFEWDHLAKDGRTVPVEVRLTAIPMGEAMGLYTVWRDIADRKAAQEALRQSELRYRGLFEQAAVGMVQADLEGRILRCNQRFALFLGYPPEELEGRSFQDVTHPVDLAENVELRQRAMEGAIDSYQMEKRYLRKDGGVVWGALTVSVVRDITGRATSLMAAVEDITERRRAQEALKESEQRFRATFEQAAVGIAHVDPDGFLIRVNRRFAEFLGYTVAELEGMHSREISQPGEALTDLAEIRGLLEGHHQNVVREKAYRAKDGSLKWASLTASVVCDDRDNPRYFMVVIEDIAQRKAAEEEIRNLARFPAENPNPVLRVSQHGKIMYANPGAATVMAEWGVAKGDDLPEDLLQAVRRSITTGRGQTVDMALSGHYWSFALAPIPEGGYCNLYAREITEARAAQEELRQERDLMELIMGTSPAGIAVLDREGRITYANPKAEEVLGLKLREMVERSHDSPEWRVSDFEGNPLPEEKIPFNQVRDTRRPLLDYRHAITVSQGQRRLLSINAAPLWDQAGEFDGIVCTVADITRQILDEEALRNSEKRLSLALEAANEGLWDWNLVKGSIYLSPRWYTMLGYLPYEMPPSYQTWEGLLHPDDRERSQAVVLGAIEHRSRGFEVEYRLRCKNQSYRWVLSRGQVVEWDGSGRPTRMAGTHADITARKEAEQAMRESEQRFRGTFEQAAMGMAHLDLDGHLLRVNQRLGSILGFPPEDMLELKLSDLMPGDRQAHDHELPRRMLQGHVKSHKEERRLRTRSGEMVWTNLSISLQCDQEDRPLYFILIVEDINQRKRQEEQLVQTTGELRAIFHALPDVLFRLDEQGRFLGYQATRREDLHAPPEEIIGREAEEVLPEAAARRLKEAVREALERKAMVSIEYSLPTEEGARFYEANLAPMTKDQVIALSRDVTERRRSEQEQQMAARVFENSIEGIVVADAEGRVQMVNPAFTTITGYQPDEVVGEPMDVLRANQINYALYEELWRDLTESGKWSGEYWNRRKSGEAYPEWLTINVIRDGEGNVANFVAIFYDITEIKRSQEQIHYQAYHDALTGLPNRNLFKDRLGQALARAQRNQAKVAVMFVDLDNFKLINDTLGHEVGDQLLQGVARRFESVVRREDTVARLGGDEFVLVLNEIDGENGAARVARAILDSFEEPFLLAGQNILARGSVGITIYPDDGSDPETLVKNADMAMYRAKDQGKHTYQLFTPHLQVEAAQRLDVENDLRGALDRDQLRLYYQPKIDLKTLAVTGMEALLRWERPGHGLVTPDRFIGVAEESGLILPIGQWVLGEACRQARAWHRMGFPRLSLAVNLSPQQFGQRDLLAMVGGVLEATGIKPELVELEITENTVMKNVEQAIATLIEISQLGVGFSVDDFGTGYSSMYYLKRFPISTLKIDRTFIRDLSEDPGDRSIVEAMVNMAHNLNLKVVAEGVETKEQLAFLQALGCQECQGYLFARPLPAEEFTQLLTRVGDGPVLDLEEMA